MLPHSSKLLWFETSSSKDGREASVGGSSWVALCWWKWTSLADRLRNVILRDGQIHFCDLQQGVAWLKVVEWKKAMLSAQLIDQILT